MTEWKTIVPTDHWEAPNRPAVYVFFLDGEAVYVGQTSQLKKRLEQHGITWGYDGKLKTPWGSFPTTTEATCKFRLSRKIGDWLMWEQRLIWRLQPRYNIKSRVRFA